MQITNIYKLIFVTALDGALVGLWIMDNGYWID